MKIINFRTNLGAKAMPYIVAGVLTTSLLFLSGCEIDNTRSNELRALRNSTVAVDNNEYRVGDLWVLRRGRENEEYHIAIRERIGTYTQAISTGNSVGVISDPVYVYRNIKTGDLVAITHRIRNADARVRNNFTREEISNISTMPLSNRFRRSTLTSDRNLINILREAGYIINSTSSLIVNENKLRM